MHPRPRRARRHAPRASRPVARRLQRDVAAAEGVHPAGRLTRGVACARVPDGVPPRGALDRRARAHRHAQRCTAALREPAVGPAVRAGARAEPCGRRRGRAVGARARSLMPGVAFSALRQFVRGVPVFKDVSYPHV
ncbi:hypothetical protein BLAT2472_90189 [Burkholderia latens]